MDTYLKKAGLTRGNVYLIALILTGGGYEHFSKSGETESTATAIALLQQSEASLEKKVDQLDHDLRALTRSVDRYQSGNKVAANP